MVKILYAVSKVIAVHCAVLPPSLMVYFWYFLYVVNKVVVSSEYQALSKLWWQLSKDLPAIFYYIWSTYEAQMKHIKNSQSKFKENKVWSKNFWLISHWYEYSYILSFEALLLIGIRSEKLCPSHLSLNSSMIYTCNQRNSDEQWLNVSQEFCGFCSNRILHYFPMCVS